MRAALNLLFPPPEVLVNGPERRKSRRDTDRYRETTDRAARVIDEARLIRLEIGAEHAPENEVRALEEILRKQVARYPHDIRTHTKARIE